MNLTPTQEAFIAAYSSSVAFVSESTLIEYFDITSNGGELFGLDSPEHIAESWDLFCAGYAYAASFVAR